MVDFYQIRSPLSQITEERMHRFIRALSEELGEELKKVPLEEYLADDFALLYVASGGSPFRVRGQAPRAAPPPGAA